MSTKGVAQLLSTIGVKAPFRYQGGMDGIALCKLTSVLIANQAVTMVAGESFQRCSPYGDL